MPPISERIYDLAVHWDRYKLLDTKIPFSAFDRDTLPHRSLLQEGNPVIYERALSIKRKWNAEFWKKKSEIIKPEERKNFQIVTIAPRDPESRLINNERLPEKKYFTHQDFSEAFTKELSLEQFGPHPIAQYKRGQHYKDDHDHVSMIDNRKDVNTVFIVASPVDETDLSEIVATAEEYRKNGAKEVILISPNILYEREDKNVGKDSKGVTSYNGRIIQIDSVMATLGGVVDRIVTYEAHSSRTQASAALHDIALVSLSTEEELLRGLNIRENPNDWVWIRPDEGRNLAATRAEKKYNIDGLHLSQIRNSNTGVKALSLTEEESEKINGKNIVIYDDEAATFNTIKNVVRHVLPADPKSINILFAHPRLQAGWEENLESIINDAKVKGIEIKIVMTDSRVPLGDLQAFIDKHPGVIEIVSVNEKNKKVIQAIVDNVDLYSANEYKGTNYEREVLNFIPGFDDR